MDKKRIGILTSGGDCPGLNAVIRGAVKSCHQLGYDCVGFLKGYEGLHDPVQYVQLTPKSTSGILNQGGTILGSTNKGRFAATVGVQDRVELDPELMEGVKRTVNQLSLDGLICIGGDGSLSVAQQFHEQGIPVVGVPKTIDNDLSATAFTFGFDSAIDCATDALDRLHTTAASHERIMVLEVMGRHAGWIALHSGIAGGGDVILIPEIPWTLENVCQKILHRESQGKKFTLVVVAEGAELPEGGLVGEQVDGQQMKLGGIGRAVADGIGKRLHRDTRLCVLGHLQRGGAPSTFDRVLATQFGAHAVRLVKEGKFGEMICYQPPEMTSVPILEAVNVLRQVDASGCAVQAARAMGISFGDRPADEIGEDVFAIAGASEAEPTPTEEIEPIASPAESSETIDLEEPAPEPTPPAEPVVADQEDEMLQEVTATVGEMMTEAADALEPEEEEAEEALESAADDEATAESPAEEISEDESAEEEATEEEASEVQESEAEEHAEDAAEVEKPVLELDEPEEATAEEATESPEETPDEDSEEGDTLQADLAKRIAEAAQAANDVEEAPEEEDVEEAASDAEEATEEKPAAPAEPPKKNLDVAELVKQKLAAAKVTAKKLTDEEPEDEDVDAEVKAASEAVAEALSE